MNPIVLWMEFDIAMSYAGRRATINLPDLHAEFVKAKDLHASLGCKEPFVFRAYQTAPRPEWHGKRCTILAKNGGVVKIDDLDTPYELIPFSHLIIDEENSHGHQ